MLINVFFHFYFACAGDVLQMRFSSFIRSLVRICFSAAFVIPHDRIFASCHQSHAIFRLRLHSAQSTQCLCLCISLPTLLSNVILFNQSLIIKYRPIFTYGTASLYRSCVRVLVLQWIDITYQPQIALNKCQKCIWNVCTWNRMKAAQIHYKMDSYDRVADVRLRLRLFFSVCSLNLSVELEKCL